MTALLAAPLDVTTDTLNIVNLLVSTAALIAALGAAIAWLKRWLQKQVVTPLATVKHEVELNDGETIKDVIEEMKSTTGRIETKVIDLDNRFTQHLHRDHGSIFRRR